MKTDKLKSIILDNEQIGIWIIEMDEGTQDKVSDILFFKQCGDMDLTLMAKYIYSISGTKFNDFLKLQVKVILEQGEIDIKKEYTDWKMDCYKDEVEAGRMSKDEIIRHIENIEF